MAKLTREELAVLNALVYAETDVWNQAAREAGSRANTLGEIAGRLEDNPELWRCGGGMDEKEFQALFSAVKNSSSLRELELLQIRESDYEKYHTLKSDAPILAFQNGSDPVVVFRGTESGSDEEVDNLCGAWEVDTEAQRRALGYLTILHDEYGFDNISVTGHSKGGNKAMYVTVRSDYVSDCTAFDSQGFSAAFLDKYRGRIAERRDRITLIAPDKTNVGALLFPIAGERIYTSTDGLKDEDWKLGPFSFHKPNVYFTTDGTNVQFREKTRCATPSWNLNRASCFLSAVICGDGQEASELSLEVAEAVLEGFAERNDRVAENWVKGVRPDGSPALSAQLGDFLGIFIPGLEDARNGGLAMRIDGEGKVEDIFTALQFLEGHIPVLAVAMAEGAAGVIDMGAAGRAGLVAAAVVAWSFVKILELVIPLLLNAGIAAAEIMGLSLGVAAAWTVELLKGIGQAVIDGFCRAVDGAVRLGRFAKDAASAAKDAISKAVWDFASGIAGFFSGMAQGASAWIQGVFGSVHAAIAYAQDIDVTMSRIEEMRRCLGELRQCYGNAKSAVGAAGRVTDMVSSYYGEPYVRSCCRDIQYHIQCVKRGIDSAERTLDRKRTALAEAVQAYRGKDQEAARVAKGVCAW